MENLQPKLRFSEFDDKWKIKNLEDITSWSSGGTPRKDNVEYWDGTIPWISASSMRGLVYINSEKKITENGLKNGSRLAKKGSLLLLVRGSMLFNKIPIGIAGIDVAFNQDLKSISVNKSTTSEYILYWFISKESKLLDMVTGTGIGAGKLDLIDLKKLEINLPSLEEQTKIASFLTAIDEKINLLKEKATALAEYKKGIMQKIFNQELRFKDEFGKDFEDWEEKMLSEIATFRRGSFPQPYGLAKWYDNENGMPFIQVYDVDDNMLLKPTTKNKISELGAEQSVFVKEGNLVITIQGSIGRIAKTQYDAYVDRTLLLFQTYKLPIDIDYFKYVVFLLFEIEKTKAPGGIIKTITKEVLSSFNVMIPSLKEQTKIATFLSVIDYKIDLVKTQLQDTQEYKKGVLQQMFV
jgi:type I restriction enzyme S subunit